MKDRKMVFAVALAAVTAVWVAPVSALPISFIGSSGSLAAKVDFDASGTSLIVTLTNISTADVLVPTNVLTAVFFDMAGNPTLSRISAVVASGSTVFFGPTDPGGVVGGEWAYKTGLVGAPGSATQGISSIGTSLFGPGDRFPGTDLQNPASPNGLEYGITSAGDNTTTGNTPVTGTNALIKNSVVFTLGGLPTTFLLSSISNVQFQYGTNHLTEPNFPGGPVPGPGGGTASLPSSMALFGAGLAGLAWLRRR